MGTVTVTGAIVIITGWFALVEFDSFPESERDQIIQHIKKSPGAILVIALLPIGIIINMLGAFVGMLWMILLGATFIFLQGIIVSLLFWKRKRWKSIVLLVTVVALGVFIYLPWFV